MGLNPRRSQLQLHQTNHAVRNRKLHKRFNHNKSPHKSKHYLLSQQEPRGYLLAKFTLIDKLCEQRNLHSAKL
jgi:hypothetical protein